MKARRVLALVFVAFVAFVWLNQSIGGREWDAEHDRFASGGGTTLERLRHPFLFLYRRSGDEAIYHATASAVLGRPFDQEVLAQRGDSPLPPITTPPDGRFHVPYAEVPFEYPPPNVPFVIVPAMLTTTFHDYAQLFCAIMAALLVVAAWLGARLGAEHVVDPARREEEEARRLVAFGLLLLAHGAIAIQRLDAVVALLVVLVVHAAARRHDARLGFYAGLVGAAKLVPILLLPVALVASGVRDRARLVRVAAGAAAGLALGLGPMLLLSPRALPLLFAYHGKRGLHVESSFGVLYGAAKAVAGARESATMDYGSFNFHGPISDLLAKLGLPTTLALVAIVLVAARRRAAAASRETSERADRERREHVVLMTLAGVVALWLGGKVFSPQYLTWAMPLVIAIPSARWRNTTLALGVVLVLSQLYLRGFYDHVYNQWPAGVITMLARLGAILALYVSLVRGRPPAAVAAASAAKPETVQ